MNNLIFSISNETLYMMIFENSCFSDQNIFYKLSVKVLKKCSIHNLHKNIDEIFISKQLN